MLRPVGPLVRPRAVPGEPAPRVPQTQQSERETRRPLWQSLTTSARVTYNIKQFTSSCVTSGNLYGLLFQAWQHESFSLYGKQCSNVIFSVMWVNMLCLTCSPERLWRPVWSRRVLGGAPEIHIQHHPPSCCRLHRTPPSETWDTHTAKPNLMNIHCYFYYHWYTIIVSINNFN